jgi:type I restriction enzyme, S subunit
LQMKRFAVNAGDFIVSCSGTIGRISQISEVAPRGIINQALLKITLDTDIIDSRYFRNYFRWETFQNRILDRTQGGAMHNLVGMPIFKSTLIALPPTREQMGIAEALEDTNASIETLQQLIAKKEAIKQAVTQQLVIGKTRLSGFTGEWEPRRLTDLLSYEQPGPFLVRTSTQLKNGRVPVLTAGKTFLLGYTNESDGVYSAHPVIIFDDFTTASQFVDFDFKAKSSAMKILSARSGANLRFLYERMQLIKLPVGDHKRYWISEYSRQTIDVPELKEQEAIAEVLKDCTDEIRSLRLRLSKACAVKQGMMQELLTGRTRLPVMEEVTT